MSALRLLSRGRTLGALSLATAGIYVYDDRVNAQVLQRGLRVWYNTLAVAADYKLNFRPDNADKIEDLHQRVADRLLHVCRTNGGLYIKIGQAIGTQGAVLPAPYQRNLKQLYDMAPAVPFSQVEKIFQREFGKHPDNIFVDFEREPMASASIAQVHRAKLPDGTIVAVKVQKPAIQKQIDRDLQAYRLILCLYEWMFDLPLSWSADYTIAHIRQEADFENEARNAERAWQHLQNERELVDRVYIPKIYWDYTCKTVMTAEYVDAVKLTDEEGLRALGAKKEEAMKTSIELFASQIFRSGFLHSDPHPGNILVRRHPLHPRRHQLVLIDHGLYIEESEKFRREYCELWKALFMMDTATMDRICKSWGINDSNIFASITLQKPYSPSKAVHLNTTTLADTYQLNKDMQAKIKNFLRDQELFPRELIFVSKNMDIVRANNKTLGAPVNRINIMARWAVRGLGPDTWSPSRQPSQFWQSVSAYASSKLNYWIFETSLFLMSVGFWVTNVRRRLYTTMGWGNASSFEDVLDQRMKQEILIGTTATATAAGTYLVYSESRRTQYRHAEYLRLLQEERSFQNGSSSFLASHAQAILPNAYNDALGTMDDKPHALWSPPSRDEMLRLLQTSGRKDDRSLPSGTEKEAHSGDENQFDLLVVGGGATGTGVAVDAATRGLKVALVERDDFASGTSSRSTKLVHGGVRYLQKAILEADYEQYKLVVEALHERANFLEIAPYLSYQLPIMLPVYKWWQVPYYWVGCKLYDWFAGREALESSYFLPRGKALEAFPMLKKDELVGALVYYDGQHNDARMNVSLAMTAVSHGAVVANYTEVRELLKDPKTGHVVGARVQDKLTGKEWDVKAKGVINATGPFTDGLRKMDNADNEDIVAPSAGVHIILPNYYSPGNMGLIDPSTSDGRVIFFLPWQGNTIAGTTDSPTEVTQNPLPKEEEITWILDEVKRYLDPDVKVRRGDVLAAWSGIRPLVRDPAAKNTESLVRNHMINVSENKLLTIAGGKWTTYRAMAAETVDRAIKEFDLHPVAPCRTEHVKLVGSHGYSKTMFIKLIQQFGLETEVAQHLANSYGDRAWAVASLAKASGRRWPVFGKRISPNYPYIEAEVRYAVRSEYACTAVDVIARRTRLAFLNAQAALESLPRVIEIMAEELKWDKKRQQSEFEKATEFLIAMGLPSPTTSLLYPLSKDNTSAGAPIETRSLISRITGSGAADNAALDIFSRAQFGSEEIARLQKLFQELDRDRDGHISLRELEQSLEKSNMAVSQQVFCETVNEVRHNKNSNRIEFDEFLEVMSQLREIENRKEFGKLVASLGEMRKFQVGSHVIQTNGLEVEEQDGEDVKDNRKSHRSGWWWSQLWNRGGSDGKGGEIRPERSGGGV
ncbi:hypothetical protein BZG36_02714 [Bifiguratus adelaidae]|uniref:Glycerol-3-phosphate dehydrogenase n=1 Tax=Bifiguratus adelaidae TaxID=1938954 RepID=A0A261Y1R3_9FUNG|nr:hypothetical protein BZG36_02714 [Bifiguratus adelaidae]